MVVGRKQMAFEHLSGFVSLPLTLQVVITTDPCDCIYLLIWPMMRGSKSLILL